MFQRLLIANRGEIARRIISTARRLGMRTIAVHSDADAAAAHVMDADIAVRIGPPPARESYLDIAAILDAARRTGAEAIHPGYGFLAENPDFAEAVAAAGLIFIGPPPSAIRAMGGKSAAKALMAKAGVPTVPGYHGADQDPVSLATQADRIGYPVLIKASAGGGGKGMRSVHGPKDFAEALMAAKREAASSFGDDHVLIERLVERPRHVEVQLFADTHGAAIYLGDRDCSIQRRHQKVVEEAPAPGLSPDLRRRMGEAAVLAAQTIGYVGAGTVEFLVDRSGDFFFMEMNTRLQVEHPVTEMVTGLDLVEWQLRIAAGAPLPLTQRDVVISGHSIEVRLYAEDPYDGFLPQTGTLRGLRFPAPGSGVRIDSGVRPGDRISPFYDPMIAKLIVHAADRSAAVTALRRALAETAVLGTVTNLAFLVAIAGHPAFADGDLDTGFIERHADRLLANADGGTSDLAVMAVLAVLLDRQRALVETARDRGEPSSPWATLGAWRLNMRATETVTLRQGDARLEMHAQPSGGGGWRIASPNGVVQVSGERTLDAGVAAVIDGVRQTATVLIDGADVQVLADGRRAAFVIDDPLAPPRRIDDAQGHVRSPMPGRVVAVFVEAGQTVLRGQPLLVLEAMKMEHMMRAPADGTILAVHCAAGEQVREAVDLVDFVTATAARADAGGQGEDGGRTDR